MKTYYLMNRENSETAIVEAKSAQDAAGGLGWMIGNCYVHEVADKIPLSRKLLTEWPDDHFFIADEIASDGKSPRNYHISRRTWLDSAIDSGEPESTEESNSLWARWTTWGIAAIGFYLRPTSSLTLEYVKVAGREYRAYAYIDPLARMQRPSMERWPRVAGVHEIPESEFLSFSIDDIHPFILVDALSNAYYKASSDLEGLRGRLKELSNER